MVKPWLTAAKVGLTQKYGEPTEIIREPDRVSITDFHSGFTVPVCTWIIDDQKIVLGLEEDESKFNVSITYTDIATETKLKKDGGIKTNL